jgi:polygalacturonase
MKAILLLVIVSLSGQQSGYSQKTYNIKDFGAIADGKTLDTQSVQTAIDKASNDGGGQVSTQIFSYHFY